MKMKQESILRSKFIHR